MKRLYSLYRWLPVLLAVVWVPAARAVHSATQSSSYFYDAPGTYTVTNVLTYSSETLTYFMWVPTVPVGWTVSNARGDGQPELMDYGSYYTIGFNAPSFKSPITFYYDVTIPSGTTGDQPVIGDFWFNKYGANDSEKAMPNPLILRQPRSISGYVFHEVDNNGIYDTWDQPATNISVLLLEGGTTNRVAAPVVTDASGYYAFGGLPDGSYDVLYWVKTNQVTVAPGGSNTNRNQLVPNSDMIIPVSITAATNAHINVGMTGEAPMSSAIDLRAYQGAEGVVVEFIAYDVEEDGWVTLFLLDAAGNPVWSASRQVSAGPRQFCRFTVPGLVVGGVYDFGLVDEVGKPWRAYQVPVTPFAAEMIRMAPAGITLAFGCLPEHEYEIEWTPRLGMDWVVVTNVVALGERTVLVVEPPDPASPSGFFRVRLK